MREILFRGKLIGTREWTEGYYSYDEPCDYHKIDCYLVDGETVGQFTGLLDKNGKRIFEGDVVTMYGTKLEIVWGADGNAPGYIVQGWGCRYIDKGFIGTITLRAKQNESLEVIGNIHDNPELLKQED